LNKLYLAYLRALGDLLRDKFLYEETGYRWFMGVDLDILIDRRDVHKAMCVLKSHGFEIVVWSPTL